MEDVLKNNDGKIVFHGDIMEVPFIHKEGKIFFRNKRNGLRVSLHRFYKFLYLSFCFIVNHAYPIYPML